ncbi:MAG: CTP synthase [Rickettsiales bacterium]|jgi:CTP synthase|nr:CTP synthase [Rickettsiales bacterium]
MTKFIFITGGVVSSLGKGIASASLGALLQARNYKVMLKKLDPYLNVDPGTMNPTQHGEVFVTDDGYEADMDLGHYERFTGINCSRDSNITTGQIYQKIINKERKGDYLGKTVQVIPHVTNEIKNFILKDIGKTDFIICEIGGTVGDIEGLPFYESIRQLGCELGKDNVCYIHLTYLPYIKMAEELKTKPTQHSVKSLQNLGIQPDILMCRSDIDIPQNELAKIAMFCNVSEKRVIPAPNVESSIYEIPLKYHQVNLDVQVCEYFNLTNKIDLQIWDDIVYNIKNPERKVKIAVVGKYTSLKESYKSVIESLRHGGIFNKCEVVLLWVESREINNKDALNILKDVNGILVTGGFGEDGSNGMILCIEYARKHKIPFLGICFGMQLAIIEFCRNVVGIENASTTEFKKPCEPIISLITEFEKDGKVEARTEETELGGTMRLGSYKCKLRSDSLLSKIYGKSEIEERHRHRYEFNNKYKPIIEKLGMSFVGTSPDGSLAECIEIKEHPFFIGVQFHPELKSKPFAPSPLFVDFIKYSANNNVLL